MSTDGTRLVVGAPDTGAGYVRVYDDGTKIQVCIAVNAVLH